PEQRERAVQGHPGDAVRRLRQPRQGARPEGAEVVMLDAAKAAIAIFVLAVIQLSSLPLLVPGTATPDLLLILVVAVALTRGAEAAALTGFAAGLLLDAMLAGNLGISSLLYIAAGVWVAFRVEPSDSVVVPATPALPSPVRQYAYVFVAASMV